MCHPDPQKWGTADELRSLAPESTLSGAPPSFPCSRGAPPCSSSAKGPASTRQCMFGSELWKRQGLCSCGQNHRSFLHYPSSGRMKFIAAIKWCSVSEHLSPSDPDIQVTLTPIICWIFFEKRFEDFPSLHPELQLTVPGDYREGEDRRAQTIAAVGRETCYNGTCRDWYDVERSPHIVECFWDLI